MTLLNIWLFSHVSIPFLTCSSHQQFSFWNRNGPVFNLKKIPCLLQNKNIIKWSNICLEVNDVLACVYFLINVRSVYKCIAYPFHSGNFLDEIHFFLCNRTPEKNILIVGSQKSDFHDWNCKAAWLFENSYLPWFTNL